MEQEEFKDPNISEAIQNEISCKGCGATLHYKPGTASLECNHCGTENTIEIGDHALEEESFDFHINIQADQEDTMEVHTVKCNGCGAQTTFDKNVVSGDCAFCGTNIVVKLEQTQKIIKPKGLLNFSITSKQANESFGNWIKGLWFAPNDLKQLAKVKDGLKGVYLPFWTYDSETSSDYTGQRGTYYYETVSYRDSNGNSRTRQVRRTHWTYVSGHVKNIFDDVLIEGSKSLPKRHLRALEPWDLENLIPFDEQFLAGFKTETYQIGLEDGFELAKVIMTDEICNTIRYDIGGDTQRIHHVDTDFDEITFKHILLPVWLCSFKYKDKVYRTMINGRTGEVQGERPWSWIKITLLVLVILAIVAFFALMNTKNVWTH